MLPGDDVLVAYPLLQAKLPRLRELAKTRRVKVAVDSAQVARDLQGIETLVEIDVGVGRCGAQSPEQAVAIAQTCSDFQGIFYWPSWLDEAGFQAACVKIDAGSKTFSSDQTVGAGTFGHFIGRGHAWTMRKLNEEHGYVEIDGPARVGEKVWVVPSHCCATVNLHDEIRYGRRSRVEGSWKVAARGKVR